MSRPGVLYSVVTVFIWALYDIVVRIGAVLWDIKPYAFVTITMVSTAITLLLFAGRGPLGLPTLKQSHTWMIGSLKLIVNVVYILMIIVMTSTEANILIRYTSIASLLIAIFVMGRSHNIMMYVVHVIIFLACTLVIFDFIDNGFLYVFSLVVIYCLVYAVMNFTIELHPQSNAAHSIKDLCRTTGVVSLVTGFIFILAPILFDLALKQLSLLMVLPDFNIIFHYFPKSTDYTHIPTIVTGIAVGAFIVSFDNYFYYYSTKVEKSENFFAVTTLLPAITLAMEAPLAMTGVLDISSISSLDLLAIVGLTLSGVYVVVIRLNKSSMHKAVSLNSKKD